MTLTTYSYENAFKVTIANQTYKDIADSIVEASIPSINIGVIDQPSPIKMIKRIGDSLEIDPVTFRFILDQDYTNWITVFQWMEAMRNFHEVDNDDTLITDISINILSNKLNYQFGIVLEDCFPVSLSDIPLTPQISDNSPLSFSCTFSVDNISLDQQES